MSHDKDEWGNIELPGFGDDKLFDPNINRNLANKANAKNAKWLKATQAGAKKAGKTRASNIEWHESLSKGALHRQTTDEGKQHIRSLVEKTTATKEWRKNHSALQRERFKDVKNNPNYKGAIIGTHIMTGEKITLRGEKEIKEAGFNCGNISECISGNRKTHKGYTWKREPK